MATPTLNFPRRSANGVPPRINKTGKDDAALETLHIDEKKVFIHDARTLPAASLDREGYSMMQHETEVDFTDPAQVRSLYYREMEALVQRATGAERCILFDHTVRKVAAANDARGFGVASKDGSTSYAVNKVHGDYTESGAPRRVVGLSKPTESGSFDAPLLSEEEAVGVINKRRFAIINVWRSIATTPVARMPLALVDCSTVAPSDLFIVHLMFTDRVGENLALDPRPEHKWCFFPQMERDEALLFKTFDSLDAPGLARCTIHSAFDDPATPPDAPDRESIEVRVLAIFADDAENQTGAASVDQAMELVEAAVAEEALAEMMHEMDVDVDGVDMHDDMEAELLKIQAERLELQAKCDRLSAQIAEFSERSERSERSDCNSVVSVLA